MRRFSQYNAKVGMFLAEYWPSHYDRNTGTYTHKPEKPEHRALLVRQVTGIRPHSDSYCASRGLTECELKLLTDDELANAEMTDKNADLPSRKEQARELTHRGYHGPVGHGEAKVLKSLFTELGMPDLVKRGWFLRDKEVTRKPTPRQIRRAAMWGNTLPTAVKVVVPHLQYCYVFKSPMEGVHFSKFIRLCRMYQGDKVMLRGAVKAVLENPEAHKEIETLDTLEILAGLPGME